MMRVRWDNICEKVLEWYLAHIVFENSAIAIILGAPSVQQDSELINLPELELTSTNIFLLWKWREHSNCSLHFYTLSCTL